MASNRTASANHDSEQILGKEAHSEKGSIKWGFAPDREVETQRLLKALELEGLALEEGVDKQVTTPFNPYDKSILTSCTAAPRRSLDDMRKLSEQIKSSKQYSRPPK